MGCDYLKKGNSMIKAYARLRETAAKSTPLRDNTDAIVAEAKKNSI